jgi:hypothetical protein
MLIIKINDDGKVIRRIAKDIEEGLKSIINDINEKYQCDAIIEFRTNSKSRNKKKRRKR